jgi:hypothetical protein
VASEEFLAMTATADRGGSSDDEFDIVSGLNREQNVTITDFNTAEDVLSVPLRGGEDETHHVLLTLIATR